MQLVDIRKYRKEVVKYLKHKYKGLSTQDIADILSKGITKEGVRLLINNK